jgi:myo-inositol-1-phosphate synthase
MLENVSIATQISKETRNTQGIRTVPNPELRLSVEDSPNSGGVVIDAIRCCKLALERYKGGILYSPSSYFMKHPPKQYTDDEAFRLTEDFIQGKREN